MTSEKGKSEMCLKKDTRMNQIQVQQQKDIYVDTLFYDIVNLAYQHILIRGSMQANIFTSNVCNKYDTGKFFTTI